MPHDIVDEIFSTVLAACRTGLRIVTVPSSRADLSTFNVADSSGLDVRHTRRADVGARARGWHSFHKVKAEAEAGGMGAVGRR